jgi:hypothetical protein
MVLNPLLFFDVLSDPSQKIINVLAIGFATLFVLLVINLIQLNKLKLKIKHLEHK